MHLDKYDLQAMSEAAAIKKHNMLKPRKPEKIKALMKRKIVRGARGAKDRKGLILCAK